MKHRIDDGGRILSRVDSQVNPWGVQPLILEKETWGEDDEKERTNIGRSARGE